MDTNNINNKNTVLLVDDSKSSREMLKLMFKDQFEILEAEDGLAALASIRKYEAIITVVLLDIVMPGMSGLEVLKALHDDGTVKHIPVILITSDKTLENKKLGHDLGAADIIEKTFDPYIINRRIKNIIELYQHKNHLEALVAMQTEELRQKNNKMAAINHQMIDSLSTVIEYRSLESGKHIKRIRFFTKSLLTELCKEDDTIELTAAQINIISDASALHDIGKIAIPDSILLKPGKLTNDEYGIMKTHSLNGANIIKSFVRIDNEDYINYCYDICRYHHERWDGKGYPDGLKSSQIPISAQVVSVADVYDALVTKRVYKQAYPHNQAVEMIVGGECGVFSSNLLKCFLNVAGDFDLLSKKYADSDDIKA